MSKARGHATHGGEDVIIGIDLGTTYSCVGLYDWQHRRVEILPNENGSRTTPSFVSYTPNECLVGEAAKARQTTNLGNTIHTTKRILGRRFSQIRPEDLRAWAFTVGPSSDGSDAPRYHVTCQGQPRVVSPEEVSAVVLGRLKAIVEWHLGCHVTKAVICVPAYFTEPQKQATKDAGLLAGLDVVKLLTEPTAAALAYGLDRNAFDGEKRSKAQIDGLYILVFDLGGGTFDVSILKLDAQGAFITKAVTGDFHLGGEDFDERILQRMLSIFQAEHPTVHLTPKSIRRLRIECEKLKRNLSAAQEASLDLEIQGVEFCQGLTRAEFEESCCDLFERAMAEVVSALELSQIEKDEIDDVVLVGGSTRIPKLQQLLQDFFAGKRVWTGINPDEAVAYGASIQGAALMRNKLNEEEVISKLTLTSVTPLTLGLQLSDGMMDVLIPRATKLPTWKSDLYTTAVDSQASVVIRVYEGEAPVAAYNNLLGQFSLLLEPAPAGVPQIEVRFDITVDGLFCVEARNIASGQQTKISIQKPNLTDAEKNRMLQANPSGELPSVALPGPAPQKPMEPHLLTDTQSVPNGISKTEVPRTDQNVRDLYELVFTVQQKVATSQHLTMQEKASMSMTASDCLRWLSTHPSPTPEEVRLKREIFELKWGLLATQLAGG
mmetsp:Transcript_147555/g.258003  ORF Transcript_147555/g.258003 Transcript_147555/m.258003 type:complete len:662 (-) Transcript_147555:328-2313(-)